MAQSVSRSDVVAFRLRAHHLTERLGEEGLGEAAGRCGVQNSPPGSALLALNARMRGLTQQLLRSVTIDDKSLLQTWCMRGSPFFFPALDAPVFTTGVLPPTEEAKGHLLPGLMPALSTLDLRLTEAVELCGAEIVDVLSGRRLAVNELGAELAGRVAHRLPANQRSIWEEEGPYAPGQPLGEGVVHFCLRILSLQGVICFAARAGNTAPFVLVDEWLGRPIPEVEPRLARAELLRRYLRSYGPSTRADFAAWVGVRSGDADAWWTLIEDEMTQVEFDGPAWVLTEDLPALRATPRPTGVRLLPPRDPYTQMRDRDTIVERKDHGEVWSTAGEPGAVLADGRITGTWRPRKSGRRLTITVRSFGSLPAPDDQLLRAEAEQVALLRGASSVDVVSEPL